MYYTYLLRIYNSVQSWSVQGESLPEATLTEARSLFRRGRALRQEEGVRQREAVTFLRDCWWADGSEEVGVGMRLRNIGRVWAVVPHSIIGVQTFFFNRCRTCNKLAFTGCVITSGTVLL